MIPPSWHRPEKQATFCLFLLLPFIGVWAFGALASVKDYQGPSVAFILVLIGSGVWAVVKRTRRG